MNLEDIKKAIEQLSEEDFEQLQVWRSSVEEPRRAQQPAIEQARLHIVNELEQQGAITNLPTVTIETLDDPEALPNWGDVLKMHRIGSIVRHNEKIWMSTYEGLNSDEPGTSTRWFDATEDFLTTE